MGLQRIGHDLATGYIYTHHGLINVWKTDIPNCQQSVLGNGVRKRGRKLFLVTLCDTI